MMEEVQKLNKRYTAQKNASKYVVTICDLCVRATPDEENEDYKIENVKHCPSIFCEAYQEKVSRKETGERPMWKGCCELFAPDIRRIRSVMAHMAMDNAKGLGALDELIHKG